MNVRDFAAGDTVALVIRYGNDLEKLRHGQVIALGAAGVQVRFDNREVMWLKASKLRHVGANAEPAAPKRPALAVAHDEAPPPAAVAPAATAPAASTLDALSAEGIDPVSVWLAMGRELVARSEVQVAAAQAEVARADEQVAAARSLLADAEREAGAMRDRLRVALASKAELERRTGGSR